jgi:hypothetical protein
MNLPFLLSLAALAYLLFGAMIIMTAYVLIMAPLSLILWTAKSVPDDIAKALLLSTVAVALEIFLFALIGWQLLVTTR